MFHLFRTHRLNVRTSSSALVCLGLLAMAGGVAAQDGEEATKTAATNSAQLETVYPDTVHDSATTCGITGASSDDTSVTISWDVSGCTKICTDSAWAPAQVCLKKQGAWVSICSYQNHYGSMTGSVTFDHLNSSTKYKYELFDLRSKTKKDPNNCANYMHYLSTGHISTAD